MYGYLPEAGNVHHADELFQLTLQANSAEFVGLGISPEDLQQAEQIIKRLSLCSRGVLSPICGELLYLINTLCSLQLI